MARKFSFRKEYLWDLFAKPLASSSEAKDLSDEFTEMAERYVNESDDYTDFVRWYLQQAITDEVVKKIVEFYLLEDGTLKQILTYEVLIQVEKFKMKKYRFRYDLSETVQLPKDEYFSIEFSLKGIQEEFEEGYNSVFY